MSFDEVSGILIDKYMPDNAPGSTLYANAILCLICRKYYAAVILSWAGMARGRFSYHHAVYHQSLLRPFKYLYLNIAAASLYLIT